MDYRVMLRAMLMLLIAFGVAACDTGSADPVEVGELSQIFTGQDNFGGELTVNYPEGWVQGGDVNGVILANNNEILENNLQTNPTDEDAVALISLLPANVASSMVNDPSDVSPMAVLQSFKQSLEQGPNPLELGEVESITINGREGAVTKGSSAQGDNLIVMVDAGGAYVNLVGITAEGQMERYREAFERIAGNVSYTLPEDMDASDMDVESDPEEMLEVTPELEVTAEATEATDE
jgi:hypothetical protein